MRGLFELFGAFTSNHVMPRWLLVLNAALSILIGILFVANPGAAAVGIAVFLGCVALLWGVVLIGAGLAVRHTLSGPEATTTPSPA